mgnify:CR=1 FL=1
MSQWNLKGGFSAPTVWETTRHSDGLYSLKPAPPSQSLRFLIVDDFGELVTPCLVQWAFSIHGLMHADYYGRPQFSALANRP